MNTSITRDLFTYKCDKCRVDRERRISWGPWLVCCRKQAQERGVQAKTNPMIWHESESLIPSSAAPNQEDLPPRDCSNHLGPFGTMQKTTCGAMWTYEQSLRENKKEKLGIEPADVLAWGRIAKYEQQHNNNNNSHARATAHQQFHK